jgi:hypothetical protein
VLLKHSPVVLPPVSQLHDSHIEIPSHAVAYSISKIRDWERMTIRISQFNHGNNWTVRIYVGPFFEKFIGSFNGVDNNDVLAQSACMHKVTFYLSKDSYSTVILTRTIFNSPLLVRQPGEFCGEFKGISDDRSRGWSGRKRQVG